MRVFALSDVHVDYDENARWVSGLSTSDYRDDLLVLAGDLTDRLSLLETSLRAFAARFRRVLFLPGNHELWVVRDGRDGDSFAKFETVRRVAAQCGVETGPLREGAIAIRPLQGWYDGSFGTPSATLRTMWTDYRACRWPDGFDDARIAARFDALNDADEDFAADAPVRISCSHFLPRADLLPGFVPDSVRMLLPVLGASRIDARLRRWGASLHVYGHSHLNRDVRLDGVRYVNSAFGYPGETRISARALKCIHGDAG